MNYNEKPLCRNDEEYVLGAQSYSSVPRDSRIAPLKYKEIVKRLQNEQCCMPSNSRPRNTSRLSRFSWRRLLSFLPSWMKNASPAGPAGFEAAAESKPKPNLPKLNTNQVQMCRTHTCTPKHSGHQQMNQECSERKCSKKSSYERILCINNFDDQSTIDQRSCCDPCMNTGTATSVNSKLLQVGVAEVSSHKTRSRCCICKKKAQKAAEPAANTSCQQSLLEQAWEYLYSIIFSHRSGCPRCNKQPSPCQSPKPSCQSPKPCPSPRPTCPNYKPPCPKSKPKPCPNSPPCVKRLASNDSSSCKESVLELVKAYLKRITSEHKSACSRCRQQPQCCHTKEPSGLRYMLEQAWAYIKKSCEQKTCQQQGALSCCTHPSTRVPVCSNPGILKYPSTKPACCCGSSKPDCPEKQLCQKIVCPKPEKPICPKICEQPPVPCKSEVEGTHEHKSCYTPCCIHNSQGIQPSYIQITGSHDKSCCLSQLAAKAKKQPISTCDDADFLQSYEEPPFNLSFTKNSSANMLGREVMGYHSSTECKAPCSKDSKDSKDGKRPGSPGKGGMRGLSLSMEPKDHKFCTRPKECKHSKQSLENMQRGQSDSDCKKTCSGPCNVPKMPTFEQEAQTPQLECPGGCEDCPSQSRIAVTPMYQEQRVVDADYEAMLDKQFGEMVAKQLADQTTICESGCSCLTCIASIQTIPKDKSANRKDPHNYRFYY